MVRIGKSWAWGWAFVAVAGAASTLALGRDLTLDERVSAEIAIQEVYHAHRIWPHSNARPKPPLSALMPESFVREKVEDDLRKASALEVFFKRPVTAEQLQAEIERMSKSTHQADVLAELFAALGHDPELIGECLAKPLLVDRLIRTWYAGDRALHDSRGLLASNFAAWWKRTGPDLLPSTASSEGTYGSLPLPAGGCVDDTWTPMPYGVPDGRELATAVWTGTEMIVWGGRGSNGYTNARGRYDPST